MQGLLNALLNLFGKISELLSLQVMFIIGLVLFVIMTIIFVAEILGYQFKFMPPAATKPKRRWNVKAITVMAMTAALSVIFQTVGALIVLVPGTITFRADAMVRFAFGAIFGMPAVWGVMLSNIIGDALAGTLNVGSIGGFVISWYMAYLMYRNYSGHEDYSMRTAASWVKYYLWSFIWCIIGSFYLCTWFQIIRLMPTEVIWVGVFPAVIVTTFVGGLLGPILGTIIGPAARRYGLSRDTMGYETEAA